jgi:hypothetical protein
MFFGHGLPPRHPDVLRPGGRGESFYRRGDREDFGVRCNL